jgi:hypothetical protein
MNDDVNCWILAFKSNNCVTTKLMGYSLFQQLTSSFIFYEKYSTNLSTIVLVVFGGFSNVCRYYTCSQAVNRYVFAPISFHPCAKLGPEQSWHHLKIKKWPITNYVQTQFSVIFSNVSMPAFWHYNVIRIWAMSGPFSRFLVLFYPLISLYPLLKMNIFFAHKPWK